VPNPQLIDLWKTREGLRCILTAAAAGPPFEVIVFFRDRPIRRNVFATHDGATAFAIASMRYALPTLSDLTDAADV
jgi:hypothetical protein